MSNNRTYMSWNCAKRRCLSKNTKEYLSYGAVGITMCDRWLASFDAFFADMGERPEGMTLDRIDNTKGYYPENCCWATRSEQQTNKRNSYRWVILGHTFKSSRDAAKFFGVTGTTIRYWVGQKGYPGRENCSRFRLYQ